MHYDKQYYPKSTSMTELSYLQCLICCETDINQATQRNGEKNMNMTLLNLPVVMQSEMISHRGVHIASYIVKEDTLE